MSVNVKIFFLNTVLSSQPAFPCLKSATETPEQFEICPKLAIKTLISLLLTFGDWIVDLEQVNAGWVLDDNHQNLK